jgi:hypothetical protein
MIKNPFCLGELNSKKYYLLIEKIKPPSLS